MKLHQEQVQKIAREYFDLDVTVKALAGEYDENFHLCTSDGGNFLLRVSRPEETRDVVDFQNTLLDHLSRKNCAGQIQRVITNKFGTTVTEWSEPVALHNTGAPARRWVRLLTFLPGRLLVSTKPHTEAVLRSFGRLLGSVDHALLDFDHPSAHRESTWDLARAGWITSHLDLITNIGRRKLIDINLATFLTVTLPVLSNLRHSTTHNDANDYNVLVEGTGYEALTTGLIDFGDAIFTPTVCNLAIALAYAMLGKRDPLTAAAQVTHGYHAIHPLTASEIDVLFQLVVTRLCVSVVNSAIRKCETPDDPYLTVSEAPAWALLEQLSSVHPRLATYKLRAACGLSPVPHTPAVESWLRTRRSQFASLVTPNLGTEPIRVFDLSVGSLDLGLAEETASTRDFTEKLFAQMRRANAPSGIGRYDEARLIYANDDFSTVTEDGVEYRTIHIGLDVFQPSGAPVFAPLDGEVHSFADNKARLDYGPCIILKHTASPSISFYTLYGHLSRPSLDGLQVGQHIARGTQLATIGDFPINGDWPPHLHFQIITDMLDFTGTYPGVSRPSDRDVWCSLSPDGNLIAGIPEASFPPTEPSNNALQLARQQHSGGNLSLSYRTPIQLVRGQGQYLFDDTGHRYLDCYNNVPHVGHSHPSVVRAAQRQLAVLNTNTRYLHHQHARYTQRLAALFPSDLSVVFLTASGSEATELAIRLARAHTGKRNLIVSEGAYHGHTNTLIDVSPYKAEGPGGTGLPGWVYKADLPDCYRGVYRISSDHSEAQCANNYALDLKVLVDRIVATRTGLCGYILESIPSVGGQIVLPETYLAQAYAIIREAGGLCIADEVQTGFGRIGSHLWAFEQHRVTPDIVALGKPIGNGYPMGAVVTTPAIAASFDNGMEFFSTFGGSTVACAVGNAVIDVLQSERLMDNAREVGNYLRAGLCALQRDHAIIGDVRGLGLMLGVELVLDRTAQTPAPIQAGYICNRMKDKGILIGTDGIDHNVLKIRGPMCLGVPDAEHFLAALSDVLVEDGARV